MGTRNTNRVNVTLLRNKHRYKAYIHFDKLIYSKIDDESYTALIKPHLFNTIDRFIRYNNDLVELKKFYDMVERRNFNVSLEELFVDLLEQYENFYTPKSLQILGVNKTTKTQLLIIWERLCNINNLLSNGINFIYGQEE